MVRFLTIDCPKCDILEEKLKNKNVEFETIKDQKYFEEKNVMDRSFPMLELEDGTILDYFNSVKYINQL